MSHKNDCFITKFVTFGSDKPRRCFILIEHPALWIPLLSALGQSSSPWWFEHSGMAWSVHISPTSVEQSRLGINSCVQPAQQLLPIQTLKSHSSRTVCTFFQHNSIHEKSSVYSFSSSCPKTVSRTREVFPTGSTTLLRLQLSRTRDCAHRSRHVGLLLFFFCLERKVPAQSKLKRVTLQPLALRTRFDHLKARFVFPGKRSWLPEGYWHMLLEAIWDGVSRDGPVSVLFSWRDYTIELEKPIRRVFFFFFFKVWWA